MILRILCCAILQFCIIGYVFGVVPQITRLNVQCDRTGMKVNVEFDNPFNGIIFSKGHYSDPNCRWVAASSSRRQFNFYIATSKCGSIGTDMARGSSSPQGFKNVIIIQNDPDYQEVWDSARKLSCDWVTRLEKYITFAPFGVDMLGVKELRFPGDTVDCWMDIQRGHGPFAPSVGGVVPIGEKLTVVIYVRDTDSSFDVHVKDCYAYDSSDYRNPDARAIKLTDEKGCAVKEKLVQGFYRTRDVRTSGATIIAYGIINAFKFPERMDVFLACNVEVCKGSCPENDCQPEVAVAGADEPAGEKSSSTTAAPSTGDDSTGDEKEDGGSSSTTEATETEEGDKDEKDEDSKDSGTGTATEETESSEDTSEKPKMPEDTDKEEETKDEEKPDEESKDDEKKDEESKDDEKKDEESKDDEKMDDEKKDDEKKDEKEEDNDVDEEKSTDDEEKKEDDKSEDAEKTADSESDKETMEDAKKDEEDKEQTKESKEKDEDEEEEDSSRKAARIKLVKKSGRKGKSSKKAEIVTPRKRSAKRPARKNASESSHSSSSKAKPKAAQLKRDKETKTKQKVKKIKSKSKSKSSDLKATPSTVRSSKDKSAKVRARIIRAPSSIPAVFSRQVREMNMAYDQMFQREGRHIRSRRSATVLSENATFPAMMHSISIISPIEDLDEKELNAWEKMIDLEGKAEEVSLYEAITKLPTVSNDSGYCFTMTSLLSASVLLAAIVMVLSMSTAMACSHLHSRSSGKVADLY